MYLYLLFVLFGFTYSRYVPSGKYWHVSDFHYDDSYASPGTHGGQSCFFPVSEPGPYGNGSCDSPWALVEDALENMARIENKPDFIIWTGDNAGHIPTPKFSLQRNLNLIHAVTSALNKTFPGIPVVPSFGNHDFFPADETNGTEIDLYGVVCNWWSSWIRDPRQIASCKRGGFYSVEVRPGLKVLAVNTVLYLEENTKVKAMVDPSRQFEWLEEELHEARSKGKKVIVSAHVPPTIPAPFVFNWFYPQFQSRYVSLVTNYSDVILVHQYGHEHADAFKILQRDDGSRAAPVFLASSVTPLRGKAPGASGKQGPRRNPAIRLWSYDASTYTHRDYTQYVLNITRSNKEGHTHWFPLYNFQSAYSVPDTGVTSLRSIVGSMAQPNGKTVLQVCRFYLSTNTPDTTCTVEEQAAFYCAAQFTDVNKTKECVKSYVNKFEIGNPLIFHNLENL